MADFDARALTTDKVVGTGGALNDVANRLNQQAHDTTGRHLWKQGTDIASASTITFPDSTSGSATNFYDVTGTTTITAANAKSAGAVYILKFDSALTLEHTATSFEMPGGVDLEISAGDVVTLHEYSSGNFRLISYDNPSSVITGEVIRSKFEFGSTTTIVINSGVYELGGVNRTITSQLTFTAGSGGSNSDSTNLGASETHYVYLDASAIGTDKALTASDFLNVTTAPTYNQSKRGWYGSATGNLTVDDRCIFSFTTDGSNNIDEFYHSGEFIGLEDQIVDQAAVDIDTAFTDIAALSIPGFAIKARVYLQTGAVVNVWNWRTNGSAATIGKNCGLDGNDAVERNVINVITDSSQIFEMKASGSNAGTIAVSTQGWYFPEGM